MREFTGTSKFPAQMASNTENVSIWWRHHDCHLFVRVVAFWQRFCHTLLMLNAQPGGVSNTYDISNNKCKWPRLATCTISNLYIETKYPILTLQYCSDYFLKSVWFYVSHCNAFDDLWISINDLTSMIVYLYASFGRGHGNDIHQTTIMKFW